MPIKVDLKDWGGDNLLYIAAWVTMGLVLFALLIWKLRLDILILIGPFIPYFVITMAKFFKEVRR